MQHLGIFKMGHLTLVRFTLTFEVPPQIMLGVRPCYVQRASFMINAP